MPLIDFSAADLFGVLQKLLPRGRVWPRDAGAVQTQALATLTPAYARLLARDNTLVRDAFPATTVELLPEWEATLGLPDPCAGEDPTVEIRQAHVKARFVYSGGQSVPYFVGYAAALGYPITVTEFAPMRFGQPFGQPMYGVAWAYAWQVNAPTFVVRDFTFGQGSFGDPFATWGNTVLQCELNRLKPAHTVLLYNYS